MTNLNEMKIKELKEMAKNLGVKNYSTLKKDDLITEIAFAIAENDENQLQCIEEVTLNEVIAEDKKASENEHEKPKLVPMPGTEDANWGEKHWGQDVKKKPRGKVIEYNGKSQTLNKWAEELGFAPQTLFARLYISNWPVEKALSTPSRSKKVNDDD